MRAPKTTAPKYTQLSPSFLAVWIGLILLLVATPVGSQSDRPAVHVAEITGVINPLTADYLDRALGEAERANAAALVLRLDTPGGLDSAMRTMVQRILATQVPVIVFIAPSGARAASAGLFISLAAHVVVMAPGTNIGAAHPVPLEGRPDPVMNEKVVADSAAYIRSLAETRGRNKEWVERAVRESVSASADEAVALGIADLSATDLTDLLAKVDGRRVTTPAGVKTLHTAGGSTIPHPMNIAERFFQVITDPTIALALISIGTIGILAEFYHPGTWYPGIAGVLSLVVAWMALGSLPTNWAGVFLLAFGFFLLVAESQAPGVGAFAAGAVIAFVLGSLLLFRPLGSVSPAAADVSLSPVPVVLIGAAAAALVLVVLRAIARAGHGPQLTGAETLVGSTGVSVGPIDPRGIVRVGGEEWSAVTAGVSLPDDTSVRVVQVDGVVLVVEPAGDWGLGAPTEIDEPTMLLSGRPQRHPKPQGRNSDA